MFVQKKRSDRGAFFFSVRRLYRAYRLWGLMRLFVRTFRGNCGDHKLDRGDLFVCTLRELVVAEKFRDLCL